MNALGDHGLGHAAQRHPRGGTSSSALSGVFIPQHCKLVGAAGSSQAQGHVVLQEASAAHSETQA